MLDAACDHASGGVFSSFSMALPNGTLLWCDYAADEGVEFAAAAQGNPGGVYDVVATGPDGTTRDDRHKTQVDLDVDAEEIFKIGNGLVVAHVVQMLDKPGTLLSGGALAGGGYGPLYVQEECDCMEHCAGDSDDMRVIMACDVMCIEDPS